ncbi:MAG TPA: UDP-4-amino-4,6-dideoxy-N-acetyl-beta-L-altrosamine transaminase [Trueperaceae bacterium]|nr:UDP-4-amino-4,6-dideoxy-N-acetyl-beta-L-altrosamine transaminase [Trueperaceae bacterium]
MAEFLPYGRQNVDENDVQAVADTLRGEYLTTGPAVTRFEEGLKTVSGAQHAVAVNSGTSALHAMYFAAGLEAGDEIVTSPLTFAATANAALYLGATVKFVDVEPDTGNIDASLVEAAVTDRTRLIVPIDFAGQPADYDALRAIARSRGIGIVADAAHSLGASHNGRPVGTLADASSVSFHPVKPITTAEGGAVLTDDAALARRARLFQTHGITKDAGELLDQDEGPWWYEQHHLGFNYRLTDVQAALGLSQLRRLQTFIDRRRALAALYDRAFAGATDIEVPGRREYSQSGWHLYVIRVRAAADRRPLFEHLRAAGIGVQVHYLPVYFHPYYRQLGYQRGLAPAAEVFYNTAISLPIFPAMTDDDVTRVAETVLAHFDQRP